VNEPSWRFETSYTRLPDLFYSRVRPSRVPSPRIALLNRELADELGLNLGGQDDSTLADLFSGQTIPPGADPIAQAYAGHQFGGFTLLGDGRAILLAEHRTPDGRLVDLQFKGTGPTPYSRRGDGLAALGPMLREHLLGEAMHALGIPTTRSLAVVRTGARIRRECFVPGAVLTRVAASHIRVGTFEYAAARGDESAIRALADYAIQRHDPELAGTDEPYLAFLRAVIDRQASLVARWQHVGFVHGVMNTDNMAISGETIDYGPCAFLDRYHPDTVFSSIDHAGRYAYAEQPNVAGWNLCRFAETLLPLLDPVPETAHARATEAIREYPTLFERYWLAGMRAKLGLRTTDPGDAELIRSLLEWMQVSRADFTNTFRGLAEPNDSTISDPTWTAWRDRWIERLRREGETPERVSRRLAAINPAVIPRNERVEEALAAAEHGDDAPLRDLLAVLREPFRSENVPERYREPPAENAPRYRTFCGT
jgi:uncharacterized protein YdiU (UPF0061 family)